MQSTELPCISGLYIHMYAYIQAREEAEDDRLLLNMTGKDLPHVDAPISFPLATIVLYLRPVMCNRRVTVTCYISPRVSSV